MDIVGNPMGFYVFWESHPYAFSGELNAAPKNSGM